MKIWLEKQYVDEEAYIMFMEKDGQHWHIAFTAATFNNNPVRTINNMLEALLGKAQSCSPLSSK